MEVRLQGFVVQLGLQFLGVGHLTDGLHEVLLGDVLPVGTDGEQTWRRGGGPDNTVKINHCMSRT